MEQMDIKKLLTSSEYDFLRENRFLGDNIILLAMGGSRAYGTNLPESDVDVRGVAINPSKQIFGLEGDFEQVVETNTDTTIYSLNKMVKLLTSCNPNTIEILGCRPQDYLYIDKAGQLLLDNKRNFLSKKAIDTFGGYATAQYNRLEHALLGNGNNNEKTLEMLMHSLQCKLNAFNTHHKDTPSNVSIRILTVDEYEKVIITKYEDEIRQLDEELTNMVKMIASNTAIDMQERVSRMQSAVDRHRNATYEWEYWRDERLDNAETAINERLVLDGDFKQYPVGDIQGLLRDFHKIKSEYGNINKRNTKKDAIHMAKHMMHLIRLYKMGKKLNESMEIQTYWDGKDHEELMFMRKGGFMEDDGLRVKPEFYDYHREVQKEYEYSVKHTILPDKPNIEALNDMLFNIYMGKYR